MQPNVLQAISLLKPHAPEFKNRDKHANGTALTAFESACLLMIHVPYIARPLIHLKYARLSQQPTATGT